MIVRGPDLRQPPSIRIEQALLLVFVIILLQMAEDDAGVVPVNYTLTSWYRDPVRNMQVGGVPTSLHLQGLAVDVVPDFPGLPSVVNTFAGARNSLRQRAAILANELGLGSLIQTLDEGDHVHIELDLTP